MEEATGSRSPDIDDKLVELSCPFNWKMNINKKDYLIHTVENRYRQIVADVKHHFPEYPLIYHLQKAFEHVSDNEEEGSMKALDDAERKLSDIKEKGTLKTVENVLQHLFLATKCHVFHTMGRVAEVDELLKKIPCVKDMSRSELAMLNGCQSLAWSLYFTTDNSQAINCAKIAIKLNPAEGKWYFLLGKNYRRLRRKHVAVFQQPSVQEIEALETAYKLSPNGLFGVTLAQIYRESSNPSKALEMYKTVYELQSTCCKVRLQLALGFIRFKQYSLAKSCLDYVGGAMSDSSIYHHYMAIYEEKCNGDLRAALPHYETATDNLNYAAEWPYIECRKNVEPEWDPLLYMSKMLEKYSHEPDSIIQQINLNIGFYYMSHRHDILSACQYFTRAIEKQPDSESLQGHLVVFEKGRRVNIYDELARNLRSALQNRSSMYKQNEIATLKNTLQLCSKNPRGQVNRAYIRSAASRMQPSTPSPRNTNAQDHCGSSSGSALSRNGREQRHLPTKYKNDSVETASCSITKVMKNMNL